MSQGNSDLKYKLEKAKSKGNGFRRFPRSDVNSLERDNSSDYDRAIEQPMISKEMRIPYDVYESYKRKKYLSSAVDTPISNMSKETSPNFIPTNHAKMRPSSLSNKNSRPNSTKGSKKRASSSNMSQDRKKLNRTKNSSNNHELCGQMDNYAAQKYYDVMKTKNHHKSVQPNNANHNYSHIGWEAPMPYNKKENLNVVEESTNKSKRSLYRSKNQISLKSSKNNSSKNFKSKKSNGKDKVVHKKNLKDLEIEKAHAPLEMMPNGYFDYQPTDNKKFEPLGKHKKVKSGSKEVHSQLTNYNDKQSIGLKDSIQNEYQEIKNPLKLGHRKAESKHENYLDKLEDNNITDEVCEIKHHDLLNYIPQKLLLSIDNADFEDLSPRSKEINSTIMIVKKSFKECNKPPITTTDFYKIGRMLGRGAFGKVSLGMHKIARKLVAIKSMNKDFLNDEKSKKKLMQEVSIIKRTRHPNVVKLYETFESGKHVLFSMEM